MGPSISCRCFQLCVEFNGVIGQLVDLTQQHLFAEFKVARHLHLSVIIEVAEGRIEEARTALAEEVPCRIGESQRNLAFQGCPGEP